jgi:hypothetical protein
MKTGFESVLRAACHLFGSVLFVGTVMMNVAGATAQNIFIGDVKGVHEVTPNGVQTHSFTASPGTGGLAFESTGILVVANWYGANANSILKITPAGSKASCLRVERS